MSEDKEIIEQHLRKWFINHPAISLSVIEIEAKLPSKTLQKFIDGSKLSEKHSDKLMLVLNKYGYVKRTNAMYIDARELRIGNWVLDTSRLLSIKITGKMIARLDDKKLIVLPISLTPDILLECGFQKRESIEKGLLWVVYVDKMDTFFYDFDTGFLYKINEYTNNIINELHFRGVELAKLEYLHQLQNIHFAITGHELEIKL